MARHDFFDESADTVTDLREKVRSLQTQLGHVERRESGFGTGHGRHDSLSDPTCRTEAADETEDPARAWTQLTNTTAIPEVRKCNFEQFKNHFSVEEPRYAVDVLVIKGSSSSHIQEMQEERKLRARHSDQGDAASASRPPKDKGKVGTEQLAKNQSQSLQTRIQRIRLQAPALLKILADIQEEPWSPRPQTFFRPFSALIYFLPQMKEVLRELEGRWGGAHSEGDAREYSVNNSPAALAILRCYVDFMEKEIMPEHYQFDRLTANDNPEVRFTDLHYLFRVGELIYRQLPSDTPGQINFGIGERLWRVYGVRTCDTQYQMTPSDHRKYDVQDRGEEDGAFVVRAFYLEYTGEEYCTVNKSFSIRPYPGTRKISALPVFPVRFAKEHEKLLEVGFEVGDKTLRYFETKHGCYNAWTVMKTPKGDPVNDVDGVPLKHPEHINSEIMIDFSEAFRACPAWRPRRTILKPRPVEQITESDDFPILWWSGPDRAKLLAETSEVISVRTGAEMWEQNRYVSEDPLLAKMAENDAHGQLTTVDYLRREDRYLIASRVFAYVFQERKFSQLDIMFVTELSSSRDALDSLRIPNEMKTNIQNSVRGHLLQKAAERELGDARMSQDIINGKGTGLFILLYGAPGVGKTATAEAIAQTNGKPLFKITCGDLGLTPAEVESKLRRIFRLASLWDCILLMDEVDTFFAQRSKGGTIAKNALVSVFLRVLDYYTGILFMTTNLPGALDEAFKSRIHYKILYPPLNRQQTLEIWEINLHRLRRMEQDHQNNGTRRPMEICDDEILRFAEAQFASNRRNTGQWNGRQIRNAFQVARSLAYADADAEAERLKSSSGNPTQHVIPAPRLQVKHFQVMDEITSSFDQYMQEVYSGMNDADLAREAENRADEFTVRKQSQVELYTQTQQAYDYGSGGGASAFDTMARSPRVPSFRPTGQGSWVSGPRLGIPGGSNMAPGRRSPSPMRSSFDADASDNGPLPGHMQPPSHSLGVTSHRASLDGGVRPLSPGGSPVQGRHAGRGSMDYGYLGSMGKLERSNDVDCNQGYVDCKNEYGKRERAEIREMF